jgi:hypothetical protein
MTVRFKPEIDVIYFLAGQRFEDAIPALTRRE